METWDAVIKEARSCHTKQGWESFFVKNAHELSNINTPKPLNEIFKLLRTDPQCLQYNPAIFGTLLRGCQASWDLELGKSICHFANSLSAPLFAIPAAQIFLECGEPHRTREVANRSLRLTNLAREETLRLHLLICNSYAEEGKDARVTRLIAKIDVLLNSTPLDAKNGADIKVQIARIHFFLGRYLRSGELFQEAARHYLELEEWESAAKSLFNTAACAHNGGKETIEVAFSFVEESRRIAEKYDLRGPLSHCEAFYGLDAFQRGNFAEAREFFHRALEFLPQSDQSYRRLHILSMLTLTYLASGRYSLARKFGKKTLELALLDKSQRYRSRYTSLKAELKWEDGDFVESQKILQDSVKVLEARGIQTLEDFSSYNRYLLQCALLGHTEVSTKIEINSSLKRQLFTYFDHQYALGQLRLSQGRHAEAAYLFTNIFHSSVNCSDRYHKALALLGLVQTKLAQRMLDEELESLVLEFKLTARRIAETPLKAHLQMVMAALSYHRGDFRECVRILKSLSRAKMSSAETLVVNCWTATIEGRSFRLSSEWQTSLLARFTKIYFAPFVEIVAVNTFRVSGHYIVDLSRHPALAELLSFLIQQPANNATASQIQSKVWRQSLHQLGWEQKIRNSIMRLRDLFPFTICPLILHQVDIRLFSEAIAINLPKQKGDERRRELQRLLFSQPMTSSELGRRLQSSPATIKRILKTLVDRGELQGVRKGRNIFYESKTDGNM